MSSFVQPVSTTIMATDAPNSGYGVHQRGGTVEMLWRSDPGIFLSWLTLRLAGSITPSAVGVPWCTGSHPGLTRLDNSFRWSLPLPRPHWSEGATNYNLGIAAFGEAPSQSSSASLGFTVAVITTVSNSAGKQLLSWSLLGIVIVKIMGPLGASVGGAVSLRAYSSGEECQLK